MRANFIPVASGRKKIGFYSLMSAKPVRDAKVKSSFSMAGRL